MQGDAAERRYLAKVNKGNCTELCVSSVIVNEAVENSLENKQ